MTNQLRTEIAACMSAPADDGEGRMSATFSFPGDFIGFKGHFADGAVLPGVCKIQAVLVLCETLRSTPARLHEVVTAKFFSPVQAGDEVFFDCREVPGDDGRCRVKASVSRGEERIAKLDLLISYGS